MITAKEAAKLSAEWILENSKKEEENNKIALDDIGRQVKEAAKKGETFIKLSIPTKMSNANTKRTKKPDYIFTNNICSQFTTQGFVLTVGKPYNDNYSGVEFIDIQLSW